MPVKWRIFVSSNQDIALGMKVKQNAGLWIPKIVARSHPSSYLRLEHVLEPSSRQMKTDNTRATINVHYVRCTLPLTIEDHIVRVGDVVLIEYQKLRAVPNYGKRGTWYKITPR